ncbi:MAG: DUF447 domain-containing protein [Planctomycetota bacterium]
MILESIVSTVATDGRVNLAPMGPLLSHPEAMSNAVGDPGFVLRPFEGSTTFDNLITTRRATIHVSDDAELFAKAAIGELTDTESRVRKTDDGDFATLLNCHRWFRVTVEEVHSTPPRFEMNCVVLESGIEKPFFGFNRAKHAVLEAAILATRVHLLEAEELRTQLAALESPVEKTAGPSERTAFRLLADTIDRRIRECRGPQ